MMNPRRGVVPPAKQQLATSSVRRGVIKLGAAQENVAPAVAAKRFPGAADGLQRGGLSDATRRKLAVEAAQGAEELERERAVTGNRQKLVQVEERLSLTLRDQADLRQSITEIVGDTHAQAASVEDQHIDSAVAIEQERRRLQDQIDSGHQVRHADASQRVEKAESALRSMELALETAQGAVIELTARRLEIENETQVALDEAARCTARSAAIRGQCADALAKKASRAANIEGLRQELAEAAAKETAAAKKGSIRVTVLSDLRSKIAQLRAKRNSR